MKPGLAAVTEPNSQKDHAECGLIQWHALERK